MRVETITIHQVIDGVPREEQVPVEQANSWVAQGWTVGPFPTGDNRPPRAGRGSGLTEWRAYAEARELSVDGLSRDEIIAAVEQADANPPITTVVDPGDEQTAADPGDDTAPLGPNPDSQEGDQ